MYVQELWRYPVKSMAGKSVDHIEITELGVADDREVLVINRNGRIVTSRTHHKLLGLKGTIGEDSLPKINGYPWDSSEARALVRGAAGPDVELIYSEGVERFDVLPLLVATDGAIKHMGFDHRRLRPNVVVGGVEGLDERNWPDRRLRIGEAVVHVAQLRGRCVMTTYDPDTLVQDFAVLKSIVRELGGVMALDCSVISPGLVRVGDPVAVMG
jgi:hypothetical protein